MSLAGLTLAEARNGLLARDFSAEELTRACLEAAEAAHPALNILAGLCPGKAVQMSRASDERLARGAARPLEGIPVGIKDVFCVEGVETRACSDILAGFVPGYESSVTARLWAAGAVMPGKLSMDEFAMGSSTETSCLGPVVNPWRRHGDSTALSPGGSSGGSAAAVAAGIFPAAVGTDTGGSIRQPASLTGIVGMKPTYGRASRYGMIAFSSSLDQAGPLTRTVADAAVLLQAMCGPDEKDSTCLQADIPQWTKAPGQSVKGMKIGIPKQYRLPEAPDALTQLWARGREWLEDAGASTIPIDLPHTSYALPAYYIISPAEASSNLARYDGMRFGKRVEGDSLITTYEKTRSAGFGTEVQRRLMIGAYVLSTGFYEAYYLLAQKVRTRIAEDFTRAFEKVDAILTPTCPTGAFALGEKLSDPIAMYLNDVFTVTANLAGLPAISVPAALDADGVPLGLQIIGRSCDEAGCLRLAAALEKAAQFTHRPQKWW